ncbi:MAG: GldG family protein [Acidobacteriota bacterium]|nr:GldG family protein [Acidobacteriota bacterium]
MTRSFHSRRRWIEGSTLGVAIVLGAVLLGMINYLGARHYARGDWTGSGLYTLSEKSRNVLEELSQPVDFVIFLAPEDPVYEPVRELLQRYAAASPEVSVREVDPLRNLAEAQRLVDEYQIERQDVVVVSSGEDRRVLDSAELAQWDYSGMQQGLPPKLQSFRGEQAFTRAVLELTEARKPRLVYTIGHGERSLDDASLDGLSDLRRLLGSDNFELVPWASLTEPEVPEGADLVLVAGPRVAFLPSELESLDRYLAGGGRVLVLVDPNLSGTAVAEDQGATGDTAASSSGAQNPGLGMASWLASYGVELGNDLVIDPERTVLFSGLETFSADSYGEHPVTSALRPTRLPVLFSLARSVTPGGSSAGGATRDMQGNVTSLVRTSLEGYGETDLTALPDWQRDEDDTAGPVSLAVAVEGTAGEPRNTNAEADAEEADAEELGPEAQEARSWRLVVVGNSTFASNRLLGSLANATLASNLFNWLVERQALLGIPAKEPEHVRLSLTGSQVRNLHLLVLLLLPGLAVAAGLWVRWRRRR